MICMTTQTMTMTDLFDVAQLNGATPTDLRGSVTFIHTLGNTPTPACRNRMSDLALTGYLYERGWL